MTSLLVAGHQPEGGRYPLDYLEPGPLSLWALLKQALEDFEVLRGESIPMGDKLGFAGLRSIQRIAYNLGWAEGATTVNSATVRK